MVHVLTIFFAEYLNTEPGCLKSFQVFFSQDLVFPRHQLTFKKTQAIT